MAVKMLKRSDEIAMNDFRTELDVLQKVRLAPSRCRKRHMRRLQTEAQGLGQRAGERGMRAMPALGR